MSEKEEKAAAPEELSIDEFLELSEEKPKRGKVDEDELKELLKDKARTTTMLRKHFSVTYSAMHGRLSRMLEAGSVVRRYKEGKTFWAIV